jgi:NAD(P)-dependent dehydrogenase (short-subunit alcohol dehydrogenase family)
MDFKGQVAMITGGARGIGRSIAGHLAQNGANLAIADVSEEAAREAAEQLASF